MEHPKDVGDRAVLAVMLALTGLGYDVSVPFGENTRYDLVIDDGARLQRVQCKSGRLRDGTVRFRTSSSYAHHPHPKPRQLHYGGQVDAFAVYCRETAGVYLIPISDLPSVGAYLRVDPTRNGQRTGVRMAVDYQVARVGVTPTTVARLTGRASRPTPLRSGRRPASPR